jgi:2-amino-4-hydroxy-6-hydroxymethyldihydropteridine diphosphokinase
MSVVAYIGIGGNLGDAKATVTQAIAALAQHPDITLLAQSSLYRTAPIASSGDDYVNAVAQISTTYSPHALLTALQEIEQTYGRTRPYINAPRTLDLDVLLYANHRIQDERLIVPHPRMTQRAFVLVPLLEISPHLCLPDGSALSIYLPAVSDQGITRMPIAE